MSLEERAFTTSFFPTVMRLMLPALTMFMTLTLIFQTWIRQRIGIWQKKGRSRLILISAIPFGNFGEKCENL